MAMRDAYSDAVLGGLTEDMTMLSTADIFSWLHTNGYFPKGAATIRKEHDLQIFKTGLCHVCGLPYRLHTLLSDHGQLKTESRPLAGVDDSFICQIAPLEWQIKRMPMINVGRLLPRRNRGQTASSPLGQTTLIVPLSAPIAAQLYRRPEARAGDTTWDSRAHALAGVSNPALIAAVRRHVSALKLRAFINAPPPSVSAPANFPQFPITPELSAAEIEVEVAPHAMLALLAKLFVRTLVKTGLDVAARDRHRAMVQVDGQRARRTPGAADAFFSGERERRMLTPGHVLRGVVARGWDWNDELGGALMGALARSGIPLHPPQPRVQAQQQPTGSAEVATGLVVGIGQDMRVKTEPPAYRISGIAPT